MTPYEQFLDDPNGAEAAANDWWNSSDPQARIDAHEALVGHSATYEAWLNEQTAA